MADRGDDRVSTVAGAAARTVVVVDPRPVVAHGLAAALTGRGGFAATAVSTETDLAARLQTRAPHALVLVLDRGGSLPVRPDPVLTAALADTRVVLVGSPAPSARWPSPAGWAVLPASCSVDQLAEGIAGAGALSASGPPPGTSSRAADPPPVHRPGTGPHVMAQLTAREREVLGLLAQGRSTQGIADDMAVSVNTVRTHVNVLLHKLGVHSRLRAVALFTDGTPDRPSGEDR
jgi:two-component system nitrate/nitrite response regulator NarL